MKPESGRTRGSKADPQIRLQRGDGSISAETMVMTFSIFFLLESSLCVSHCIPSHQTINMCSPFQDLSSPIANLPVRHVCPPKKPPLYPWHFFLVCFSRQFRKEFAIATVSCEAPWRARGSPLSPPPCLTTTSLPLTCFSSFGSTLCAHLFCPPKKVVIREVPEKGIPFLSPPAPCLTVFTYVPTFLHGYVSFNFKTVVCYDFASLFLPFLSALFRFLVPVFSVFSWPKRKAQTCNRSPGIAPTFPKS